ncbi:MAG: S8 family serine peptidase [Chloroflexi bacterium]|nr:S8 family serine peptidase [Chloroflexota bacterium]
MKRRAFWIGLCVIGPMVLLLWLGQGRERPAAATARLETPLETALTTLPSHETLRFIVHLSAQPALAEEALPPEKVARRQAVVTQLQDFAAASQAALLRELSTQQGQGNVTHFQPLWVINAVIVEGNAAAIATLAARPDVASLSLDAAQQYLAEPTEVFTSTAPTGFTWGVKQVMAPHAWYGLGVNGTGVVVAIMDTGVDWQHPALAANYRGNQGGGINHIGHWYDPVENSPEPIDPHNHGTHVAGTAVGQLGIGVAPGAQWIGVRMLNSYGQGFPSEIHLAFQWLLAPAGNPALAPDVVNASWGSGDGLDTTYQADIQMLHAAGIIPVFAAGNSGPDSGSVGSPASLPDVLAVGASDSRDIVTWFSSRGPSPLTNEIKPELVAPGGGILSSLPGGNYGVNSGTSMATPHVAGAAALLLSANPQLTRQQVRQLLRSTATPINPPHPNPQSGYGRLDAYALVANQVPHGLLMGQLVRLIGGAPSLAHTPITITTPGGETLIYQTDEMGARPRSNQAVISYRWLPLGISPLPSPG